MINDQKSTITLISIIPNVVGGEGHIIPYHISVNEATKILGWQHKLVYSSNNKKEEINNLPKKWNGCLNGADLEAEVNFIGNILKLFKVFIFAKSIVNYLQKEISSSSEKTIIFIERFIHLQLFALWLALLFIPVKNVSVWILYRRDTHNHKTRSIYKLINKLIKNWVSAQNFRLLTDSQLLSQSLSNYFQEKVTVMPIPHTELIETKLQNNNAQNDYIICWWPGPPREEKGWQVIRNIVNYQSIEAEKKFCLVAAKSANLNSVKGGINVNLIEDNLNRFEYVQWLTKANFILLPYDAQAYKERTSGIFTESIIAGKIMLVTPNSWMAQELSKYGLEMLVIDWDNLDNIFKSFQEILDNQEIQEKIKVMQKKYISFHNVNNYAVTMQNLLS